MCYLIEPLVFQVSSHAILTEDLGQTEIYNIVSGALC